LDHTRFPQPGQLKGMLGIRLKNGRIFTSKDDLCNYWTGRKAEEVLGIPEQEDASDEDPSRELRVSGLRLCIHDDHKRPESFFKFAAACR
jgi:hypothetical protein